MAEIVNLRQARKRKRRQEHADEAAANRAKHGLSRSERDRDQLARDLDEQRLDAHRRDLTGRANRGDGD